MSKIVRKVIEAEMCSIKAEVCLKNENKDGGKNIFYILKVTTSITSTTLRTLTLFTTTRITITIEQFVKFITTFKLLTIIIN